MVESTSLQETLKKDLSLADDFSVELYVIYDIFNADDNDLALLEKNVIAEPAIDEVLTESDLNLEGKTVLAFEFLPGQYDQRADSAMQCLMLLNNKEDVRIHSGTLMVMENVTAKQLEAIEHYMINPVESRKKDMNVLDDSQKVDIQDVPVVEGFINLDADQIAAMRTELGLAMSNEDLAFIQDYFKNTKHRDPFMTEIRVLDTYWSDHCRHTTFETILKNSSF